MLKKFKSSMRSARSSLKRNFGTLTMCKKCHAFYYKRIWHFEAPGFIEQESSDQEIPLRLTQCPACIEFEVTLEERDGDSIPSYGMLA